MAHRFASDVAADPRRPTSVGEGLRLAPSRTSVDPPNQRPRRRAIPFASRRNRRTSDFHSRFSVHHRIRGRGTFQASGGRKSPVSSFVFTRPHPAPRNKGSGIRNMNKRPNRELDGKPAGRVSQEFQASGGRRFPASSPIGSTTKHTKESQPFCPFRVFRPFRGSSTSFPLRNRIRETADLRPPLAWSVCPDDGGGRWPYRGRLAGDCDPSCNSGGGYAECTPFADATR